MVIKDGEKIMTKYLVQDITYKNGETRTDGRYPNRIGSVVQFLNLPSVGEPLVFRYVKYNNGECVEDHVTRTSRVDDYDEFSHTGYTIVYTRNSIYYFKALEE